MTARELITELNSLDEHSRIEAKTAEQVGKSSMESVCAFANEPGLGGGYLVMGVRRVTDAFWPTYEACGVPQPDKLQSEFASLCASYFNVPVRPQIKSEDIDGKVVVTAFIPEAQSAEKPVFIKNLGLPRGAFRRIGSTDQHCSEDDLILFYHGRQQRTFDETIIDDATVADIDPKALAEYRRFRSEADRNAEELRWSDADLLVALGCGVNIDGGLKPTLAGILLFGTPLALRRFVPMMRIDYIRVPGKEWVNDPERRFETIEIRSPLIVAMLRAHAAVFDDIPKAFRLPKGALQRNDVPLIPDRVIREAIVNAVMHRTYRSHSPVQIIRYANRLEIRNPGHSLVSSDRFGEPGSVTRNPKIAAVLHETRFAETKGSGIRVMRESMKIAGLSAPIFKSDRAGDQFVATFLFHHFLSPEDIQWLKQFKALALTNEESKALIYARETQYIDNAEYREINAVDTLTASGSLRRLRDAGLLDMRGKGAATFYVPTEKLFAATVVNSSQTPDISLSVPIGAPPAIGGVQPLPQTPDTSKRDALLRKLPSKLQDQLKALGSRGKPEKVRSALLALCSRNAYSASELSILLARDQTRLTRQYLTPMLKAEELRYTRPKTPAHPKQAYRAGKKRGGA